MIWGFLVGFGGRGVFETIVWVVRYIVFLFFIFEDGNSDISKVAAEPNKMAAKPEKVDHELKKVGAE